jgi:uncharacterized protein (DUF305 family)
MRSLKLTGMALIVAMLQSGCIAAVIGDAPHSGTATDMRARSAPSADTALAAAVSARLDQDAALRAARLMVTARAGAVTLEGAVATSTARTNAERLARAVAGVQSVNNQIKVKPT